MHSKKIVIQCPCYFTRKGIEELLAKPEEITNFSSLSQCVSQLNNRLTPDIVIVTLSSMVNNPAFTLRLFGELLPFMYPSITTLIIADMAVSGVMARYLCGLKSVWGVLETSESLAAWQNQLRHLIQPSEAFVPTREIATPSLSLREMTVMWRLLDGQKTAHIAYELCISPKTVSYYKRSALVKLGIRSLQPLMIKYSHRVAANDTFGSMSVEKNGMQTHLLAHHFPRLS